MDSIEYLVLDEADELLTMGFIDQIRDVLAYLPTDRRTHLFSATLPPEIKKLSSELQHQPVFITIDERTTPDPIDEYVYPVPEHQKLELLLELIEAHDVHSMIVFASTRKKSDWLYHELWRRDYSSDVLHSDKTLKERKDTFQRFKDEKFRILLATDLAARGIDIPHLTHITNFDLPDDPQDYIHRVGRTGRIGRAGTAWTLMDPSELILLAKIERLTGKRLQEKMLEGFEYEEAPDTGRSRMGRKEFYGKIKTRTKSTKENPFTKSGQAKKKYSIQDQSKKKKKKIKLRKKLPHTK